MTKLEEEIIETVKKTESYRLLNQNRWGVSYAEEEVAKAAAQVALQWIEKFCDDTCVAPDEKQKNDFIKSWLSANGLTPPEPLKEEGIIASNGLQNPEFETKG